MPEEEIAPENTQDDINMDDLFAPKPESQQAATPEVTPEKPETPAAPAIDPNAITKAIEEGIQKGVAAVTSVGTRATEVDTFLKTEEGKLYEQYGDKIKQAAQASEYKHLPISNVVGLVLGTKMATILAGVKADATAEQKGNQGGGGTPSSQVRNTVPGEKVSAWNMDKSTFEQTVADAKAGKFVTEQN